MRLSAWLSPYDFLDDGPRQIERRGKMEHIGQWIWFPIDLFLAPGAIDFAGDIVASLDFALADALHEKRLLKLAHVALVDFIGDLYDCHGYHSLLAGNISIKATPINGTMERTSRRLIAHLLSDVVVRGPDSTTA